MDNLSYPLAIHDSGRLERAINAHPGENDLWKGIHQYANEIATILGVEVDARFVFAEMTKIGGDFRSTGELFAKTHQRVIDALLQSMPEVGRGYSGADVRTQPAPVSSSRVEANVIGEVVALRTRNRIPVEVAEDGHAAPNSMAS